MSALRIVLDTNLFVSYLLTQGETLSRIIGYWRQHRILVLVSPAIIAELIEVLARTRLRDLMVVDPERLVRMIQTDTVHTAGELEAIGACRDWKDEKFLACAVEGRADFIVTGDHDLLELLSYQGIPIIRAYELIKIIEAQDDEV